MEKIYKYLDFKSFDKNLGTPGKITATFMPDKEEVKLN